MEDSRGQRKGFFAQGSAMGGKGKREGSQQFIPVQPPTSLPHPGHLPMVFRRQAKTCLLFSLCPAVISNPKGCPPFLHPLWSSEQLSGSKKALVLSVSLEKPDRQWEAPFSASSLWLYFLYHQEGKANMMVEVEFTENEGNAHLSFK